MFRTSTPVTDASFFDRAIELTQLEDCVKQLRGGSPRWMAVLGRRKVGKTSLLLELTRRARTNDVLFTVVDSFEDGPVSFEIFRRLAVRVADAFFSRHLGVSLEALLPRPDDYRAALLDARELPRLPRELRADLLGLADAHADLRLAETALGLAERLAVALGRFCVVAWDEFQALAALHSRRNEDVLSLARAVWQKHRRTMYVICGSERTMLRELITSEHSPFFQHFSVMELGPMSREDAKSLVMHSAASDRPIPSAVAERAVEVLGGHPFYLQMFGETLTTKSPPYDEAVVRQVFSELLFSRTGRLSLFFANELDRVVGRAATLLAVLEALADGPKRVSVIARETGTPAGTTVRYLERLGDAVTRTSEGQYAIEDPVFGLWLRWRKPGGTIVPMAVIGDEAELEVAKRLAEMGFELVYQSRASRGAFDLLGIRDGAQLGIQVKRSPLPLRFSKTQWHRISADARRLGWRFVIAAVAPPPSGKVVFLSPQAAHVSKAVTLGEGAIIDNLLDWMG